MSQTQQRLSKNKEGSNDKNSQRTLDPTDDFQSYVALNTGSKGPLTNINDSEQCPCCVVERKLMLANQSESAIQLKLRARQIRKMAKQVREGAILGQKAAVFVRDLKGK